MGDWVSGLSATSLRTTPLAWRWACHASRSTQLGTKNPAWVKPGSRFAEEAAVIGVVAVEHDYQLPLLVGEELADPSGMWGIHQVAYLEHVFVPACWRQLR